jgi:hypothetical protein
MTPAIIRPVDLDTSICRIARIGTLKTILTEKAIRFTCWADWDDRGEAPYLHGAAEWPYGRQVFPSKRFFVDKIVKQAVTDGAPLSDAERQMLSLSESDPKFVVSPALVEKLQAEISDEDYETRVASLLDRSWGAT